MVERTNRVGTLQLIDDPKFVWCHISVNCDSSKSKIRVHSKRPHFLSLHTKCYDAMQGNAWRSCRSYLWQLSKRFNIRYCRSVNHGVILTFCASMLTEYYSAIVPHIAQYHSKTDLFNTSQQLRSRTCSDRSVGSPWPP